MIPQSRPPAPAAAAPPAAPIELLRWAFLLLFVFVLARTAWMCDDAFITLRVVDNIANGYGPVWNTDERVQVYTHPLWMMTLAALYLFTREPYFTTLALSMALSLLAVWLLLWKGAQDWRTVSLMGVWLVGSKAFVDYATSGLENPLTHALLVVFALLYIRHRERATPSGLWGMAIVGSALALNRLDTVLLWGPALFERLISTRSRPAQIAAVAFAVAPVLGWMAFSLFYYGFPLPNTYYAKQAVGVAREAYLLRGLDYFAHIVLRDPVTPLVIVVALLGLVTTRGGRKLWALGLGIALYLLYILWVGGDFFGGRFFTAVFTLSALCAAWTWRIWLARHRVAYLAALAVSLTAAALTQPIPNVLSDQNYQASRERFGRGRINDERGAYYPHAGLLPVLQGKRLESFDWAASGVKLRQERYRMHIAAAIGFRGYFAGPEVTIIDYLALGDAFLARLPYTGPDTWAVGHLKRSVPDGYLASRLSRRNMLGDPQLNAFYDHLRRATQGDVWDVARFESILALNLRPPNLPPDTLDRIVSDVMLDYFALDFAITKRVPEQGLLVFAPKRDQPMPSHILFRATPEVDFAIQALDEALRIERQILAPGRQAELEGGESVLHVVPVPATITGTINAIRLIPLGGGRAVSVGDVRFVYKAELARPVSPQEAIGLPLVVNLSGPRGGQRWVMGRHAFGLWWAEQPQEMALRISATPFCDERRGQRAVLMLNHTPVGQYEWRPEACAQAWQETLRIPAALARSGLNVLELQSQSARWPSGPDAGSPNRPPPSLALDMLRLDPTHP